MLAIVCSDRQHDVSGAKRLPRFGAPFVFVLACLILVAQSRLAAALMLFVFASLVVFVADHFIRPVLIGRSTRLPFLWVLLGIFGGLEAFGLLGLFLGPAIIAVA